MLILISAVFMLIFALLGFKRNIMATLGILLLVGLTLFLALGTGGLFMAAAILIPFVLLFSNGAFMSTYAAYFKIKEIMIDPYEEEHTDADMYEEPDVATALSDSPDEEPIG